MGADARWVCHTCKTVCARGGRPLVKYDAVVTLANIPIIKDKIYSVVSYMELDDLEEKMISFLNDLNKWLKRHNGHKIHIGSDYSTDMMDLEDYRNETVDGHVDKRTRGQFDLDMLSEVEAESIADIKKAIEECVANPEETSPEKVAIELYRRFSTHGM